MNTSPVLTNSNFNTHETKKKRRYQMAVFIQKRAKKQEYQKMTFVSIDHLWHVIVGLELRKFNSGFELYVLSRPLCNITSSVIVSFRSHPCHDNEYGY